jgi:L-seryl-tRNA(Ser) seleniumtransferase
MIREDDDAIRTRAERLAATVGGDVEPTIARVGGGALPLAELPSFACAVDERLADELRSSEPPVIGVVRDGRLLLDCRTLSDDEANEVAAIVLACR